MRTTTPAALPGTIAGFTCERFAAVIAERGWLVIDGFVDADLVERMRADLASAYAVCRSLQIANGIALDTEGTLHHLIGLGASFLEFIDGLEPVRPHFERHFRGRFILNSFGGNILGSGGSYANAVHRDIRTSSGNLPLLLNTLVMLDDFTPANGATLMMTGSHRDWPEQPDDAAFHARAEPALGRAGSMLVFDSHLWHAAGVNRSDRPRRSVTPMYCRPFIKPQFDYPRALGYDRMSTLSPLQQQVLGYHARIPATLAEWYRPASTRLYQSGQG
ncbi:MAG: phytanoyl-CoA dioxygenase family protein [Proteobacteria bacterium]|nr:phytanoyl-CoA dioxygenase family protein [Burkholderiales bacterium]